MSVVEIQRQEITRLDGCNTQIVGLLLCHVKEFNPAGDAEVVKF
jgi:hypothetical protein